MKSKYQSLMGKIWIGCALLLGTGFQINCQLLTAAESPKLAVVDEVEIQPFNAHVQRLVDALDFLGAPLSEAERSQLKAAAAITDTNKASESIQAVLDPHCIAGININPEMRVKLAHGAAKPQLAEKGWTVFLVKVHNESGTTAELRAVSPNALSVHEGGGGGRTASDRQYRSQNGRNGDLPNSRDLWLDLDIFKGQPMKKELSGLKLEYVVLQVYSRDAGKLEGKLAFNVGQGTQDLGFRNELDVLFNALPSAEITFDVKDENGKSTMASFVIRDQRGRVYPPPSKRLAPDFPFHPQIYREDGEKLRLPKGEYSVTFTRGPEYVQATQKLVATEKPQRIKFKLDRWIDPSRTGWWSGDHHIHAAGCAHYTKPTEGVHAPDMMRHCLGEDLKIGANLTWGPCFDYQKQFFTGKIDKVSKYPYLLRYDVEVSGFGSHRSGHLCLLRLKEQIYPGGDSDKHWPTLCLNTLRWAKKQGALVGPAHSGWGLQVESNELPNYLIPPFEGIGANEYIVDVTHQVPGPDGKLVPAVDFLSMVDTPSVWELNIWYHTLNVGYRTRISGETDFPCIYGERVGLGRSYVRLDGKLDYDAWCEGIRQGRNYVSDGRSHLLNFSVNGHRMGDEGSEVRLSSPGSVKVTAQVAALLDTAARPDIKARRYDEKPYWDIERARIVGSNKVPLEIIVNGYPVAKREIIADGKTREVEFDVPVSKSSWVAMRVYQSSHTNPIFVVVDGKPIRASKRSAEWCLQSVDQCWSQKQKLINTNEMDDAKSAYEHARQAYKQLVAESTGD